MAQKISLYELSRELPPEDEFDALINSLSEMEARGATLIIASILDSYLEHAISASFVEIGATKFNALFRDRQAPFSSFGNKIRVAHALGVFNDEIRAQLDRIRSIRNAFAHTMQAIDFDHPVISVECSKLNPSKISGLPFKANSPRESFLGSATLIGIAIICYLKERESAVASGSLPQPKTYECNFAPARRNSSENHD